MTIVKGPSYLRWVSSSSALLEYTTWPRSPPIVPAFSPCDVLQLAAKPSRPYKFNLYFWNPSPVYWAKENPLSSL